MRLKRERTNPQIVTGKKILDAGPPRVTATEAKNEFGRAARKGHARRPRGDHQARYAEGCFAVDGGVRDPLSGA